MSTKQGIPQDPKQNDRPDELPAGARIERRADGSVWQVRPAINPTDEKTGKERPGPDTLEFRVDSPKDRDFISKGGSPWYYKYLDEVTPNAGRTDSTQKQITALMERLDKAEARADAAESSAAIDRAAADAEISTPDSAKTADIKPVPLVDADIKPAPPIAPPKAKGKTRSKSKK